MKKTVRLTMLTMAAGVLSLGITACGSDDDEPVVNPIPSTPTAEQVRDSLLGVVNKNYVEKTIVATYTKLADDCEKLKDLVEDMDSQADLEEVCRQWKQARQDWELSESFLFGAASGYGIDPHIDTWPFAEASFLNLMSKLNPSVNEADAAAVDEQIVHTQGFTGFHAMEYVIFRDGQPRQYSDLTADELYFVNGVAQDLFLNACRLEVAWAGDAADDDHIELLEEEELMPDDAFGREFVTAGQKGSRWASVLDASVQIVDGCIDIIGEVADSKIAAAYTGDDVNYIESPHAYNSIQDFYDNIRGCKQALYGGLKQIDAATPAENSLMDYCLANYPAEAQAAMTALDNALSTINQMKRPFVLYYKDTSAGKAIDALHALDDKLTILKLKLDPTAKAE